MKRNLIVLVLLVFSSISYSQQDAQYTQYMYNTLLINPGYAGSRNSMNFFVSHRNQWVGIDGAPVTSAFSIHTPFKNTNLGLGLSFFNDKIGPSNENNIAIDFSYSIPISDKYKLSFGLKTSANLLNIDYSKLSTSNEFDPKFQNNIDNKFSPNIGVGVYVHSKDTYFGLSTPKILETKHFDGRATNNSSSYITKELIHYYIIVGHIFDLNSDLKFKPSLLTKIVKGAPMQVDISGNFLINDKITAGLSYRMDAAVSGLVGVQVDEAWFFGYSYDFDTTKFVNYNSGSHELFLRYELFKKNNKIISPRFF